MLFSSRLPLSSLIEMCRVLRHNLGAGLSLVDVFRQLARKGSAPVRPVAQRIVSQLQEGHDLEKALDRERAAFPPLLISMAVVAEQTGNLPEVFRELERYFVMQQKLRRQFLAASAWPLFQFVAAIGVITLLILLLGVIAEMFPGSTPFNPLGLLGVKGAVIFLSCVFGTLAVLVGGYLLLTRTLQQRPAVDRILLRLPVLGPCLSALALARFCLALRLTLETGMPITRALRLSLRATGNAAFMAQLGPVTASLEEGDELAQALATAGVFPENFRNIVAVAEEGGRLTESLEHETEHYQEEAGRRLVALTTVAGWGVWVLVGTFIVFVIFRIMFSYLSLIEDLTK